MLKNVNFLEKNKKRRLNFGLQFNYKISKITNSAKRQKYQANARGVLLLVAKFVPLNNLG